ncbi:MAG TPA: hypothetical protein DEP53_15815 [Bacteroidetes bacterium]|nr:hypothetical protein [Bacteroidota bacterium]
MKRIISAVSVFALVAALGLFLTNSATAQTKSPAGKGTYFVDKDGDGVCDNLGTKVGQKMGNGNRGKGFGPGDGTGNKGQGPKDGTGFGARSGNGTGVCDGTGPKGTQARGGRK